MKKKNKSMYLVLTLLLLLVAGFTTYAIYKTSATGSANVSAANWVVKVTANNTTTNVTGGSNSINLGECANRLAPGSSCTIPFTVDMTESEVDSILTVGIGSGINQDTLSLMNEAGLSLKISDGTNEGYAYTLNYGTTKVLNLVIDWEAGDEDDDNKASADVALSKTVGTLTIPVNMTVRQFNGLTRTVTFNKNTEDSNIETPLSQTVTDGGTISTIPDLNSENVIFVGWYTSPTGGTKLTSTTPITDDITYYAHYGSMKTLTFNSNGGSSVNQINIGEGRTLSTLPTSTKAGFELIGWFDENNNQLTTSTVINTNKTYTAMWQVKTYTLGEEVYFDPVNINSSVLTCNLTEFSVDKINNDDDTCYKWNVLSDDGDNITMQLDHNTTKSIAWAANGNTNNGAVTLNPQLEEDTADWNNVEGSARLITYDEIKIALGMTENLNFLYLFNATNPTDWLVQNTKSNQYGSNNDGYWSSTSADSTTAYVINDAGNNMRPWNVDDTSFGIRPVITIPKSKIQ